jgi:hypothetical protein
MNAVSTSTRIALTTLSLLLSLYSGLYSQIVVTGTSFDPLPGNEARAFIGLNDIVHYGVQRGSITSTPPIAPNVNAGVFNANYYYAITDNPIKLDNTMYTNLGTPDYQFVYSPRRPTGTNINILEYVVKGMLPGSAVSVRVQYCSVVNAAYAPCNGQRNEFKAGINLDANNQLNGTDATQIGMGQCATATFNGTVAANGDMIFRMNATRDGCVAMGIRNIEVVGFIKPIAISNMGTEVCVGEQISLQPTQNYNAIFQWQVRIGAGTWSNAANGTGQSLLYEVASVGTYQFRLQVTPLSGGSAVTTDPITVTAITCCTVGTPPVAASRQTVYYDNFGRLNMADRTGRSYYVWDYSNVLNPVEVARTTTTPFRWPLTPAPLGATFVGTPGPLQDGQYTVASFLTGYNYPINGYDGARLEWANRVRGLDNIPNPDITYDFSGQPDGAALFLNCPVNTGGQTLYSRTINNLCFGKQLFFECWISVFTNSANGTYNPVNVRVRLTEVGNNANTVTTTATATREADGGGTWVRVAAQINLISGNSVLMEIINNQNVSENGNDLVLDDIKIMACAPPAINLYFDLNTLSESTSVCGGSSLDMATRPSNLLKAYYGNAPRFLFQWSRTPAIQNSWQNIGLPLAAENANIANISNSPAFAGLADGGRVFFRVIAASAATFTANNNFTGANSANPNDPCKSYSVSDPIQSIISCPLPAHMNSWKGWRTEQGNRLQWACSQEQNNHYFLVEKSSDGIHFDELSKVNGKNLPGMVQLYTALDETPSLPVTYYRLKQVDLDNSFVYSPVIAVSGQLEAEIALFPNPTQGQTMLQLSGWEESATMEILDAQGRSLHSNIAVQSQTLHELPRLSPGIYVIKVQSSTQQVSEKLIVY